MTVAPASGAAFSWAASWPPSTAPMMTTLAPLVIIAWIWLCWSATAPDAPAYCTSGLKPADLRPSVNRPPARTQFSDVLVGRATPMVESLANPAAVEASPPEPRLEQPLRASAAAAATATVAIAILRMCSFTFSFWMVQGVLQVFLRDKTSGGQRAGARLGAVGRGDVGRVV